MSEVYFHKPNGIAGKTLAEWREFARRDDCLDRMVSSDLRLLVAAASAPTDAQVMAQSAADVLADRQRQIDKEGWDNDHDDDHSGGELAAAAACYAFVASHRGAVRALFDEGMLPPMWPEDWDVNWWKPTTPRGDLVKAAALILAEIDRLDRAMKGGAA